MVQRNVGGVDRIVRGVLGVVLVAVAVDAVIDERRTFAAIVAAVGVGFLSNAVTGYCGGNAVLGIDTCSSGASSRSSVE